MSGTPRILAAAALVSCFVTGTAWAESPQGGSLGSPTGSSVRPDVVRLKNGGMVRGIIDARVPDEYVVITLPGGDSKRFDWSEIEYAGPERETGPAIAPADSVSQSPKAISKQSSRPPRAATAERGAQDKPPDTPMHPVRLAGIVAAASGGTVLTLGIIMLNTKSRAARELDRLCGSDQMCESGDSHALDLMAQNNSYKATATLVTAGGLLSTIVGVVLIVSSPRVKPSAIGWKLVPAAPRSDLGGLSLSAQF